MTDRPRHATVHQKWCILTCEYPPMPGGVSDHTLLLARAFVAAGDTVDIWTPKGDTPPPTEPGISVQLLPSLFGFDTLRVLRRLIREQSTDTRILIQYVPTSFGWRMMNIPFALMLFSVRNHPLDVYFHEVGFPIARTQRLRRNIAGAVHVVMNWFTVRAASRVFVAIPEWARRLERLSSTRLARRRLVTWVPVPSNVPSTADEGRITAIGCRSILAATGGSSVTSERSDAITSVACCLHFSACSTTMRNASRSSSAGTASRFATSSARSDPTSRCVSSRRGVSSRARSARISPPATC